MIAAVLGAGAMILQPLDGSAQAAGPAAVTNDASATVTTYPLNATSSAASSTLSSAIPYPNVPAGAAIDGSGDLWVPDYAADVVTEYTPPQQHNGSPAPHTVITSAGGSLDTPVDAAFDVSGDLWVSNFDHGTLVEYTPAQLTAGGAQTPNVVVNLPNSGPIGLAFDTAGDLWVVEENLDRLVELTPLQLLAGGTPSTPTTIGSNAGSLNEPQYDVFDTSNGLWVTNFGAGSVVHYTAAQLATSGSPAPANSITPGSSSSGPEGLKFDSAGSLWVALQNDSKVVQLSAAQLASHGSVTPAGGISLSQANLLMPLGLAFTSGGGLWVTVPVGSGGSYLSTSIVVQYSAAQLAAGGGPVPVVTLSATLDGPQYDAYDSNGNLWVSNFAGGFGGTVVEYAAAQIAGGGQPAPLVTLAGDGSDLTGPEGIAFDSHGDLWVLEQTANALDEFTPAQLASGGEQPAAVRLTANGDSLDAPAGLAFDAAGNAWVSNLGTNTVVEFSASSLAVSGSPPAAVTLSSHNGNLVGPAELAFDAAGNLWVANSGSDSVVEFAPAQLASSGSPAPVVRITAHSGSLDVPTGLGLDPQGNLWVVNLQASSVVRYASTQLSTSGSPAPALTISGGPSGLDGPVGIALDYAPTPQPPPSIPEVPAVWLLAGAGTAGALVHTLRRRTVARA